MLVAVSTCIDWTCRDVRLVGANDMLRNLEASGRMHWNERSYRAGKEPCWSSGEKLDTSADRPRPCSSRYSYCTTPRFGSVDSVLMTCEVSVYGGIISFFKDLSPRNSLHKSASMTDTGNRMRTSRAARFGVRTPISSMKFFTPSTDASFMSVGAAPSTRLKSMVKLEILGCKNMIMCSS